MDESCTLSLPTLPVVDVDDSVFQPLQFFLFILRYNAFAIVQYHHLIEHDKHIGDFFSNGKLIVFPSGVLAQLLLQFGHFFHDHERLGFCAVCRKGEAVALQ